MVRIEIRERPLYEVANAYDMNSMELLRIAKNELNLAVKSHMTVLSNDDYEKLIKYLEGRKKKKTGGPKKPTVIKKKSSVRRKVILKQAPPQALSDEESPPPPQQKEEELAEKEPPVVEAVAPEPVKETAKEVVAQKTPQQSPEPTPAEPEKKGKEKKTQQQPHRKEAVLISLPDSETRKKAAAAQPAADRGQDVEDQKARARKGKGKLGEGDDEGDKRVDRKTPHSLTQKTEVFRPVDYMKREYVYRAKRKRIVRGSGGVGLQTAVTTPGAHKRVVEFNQPMTVDELARKLNVKSGRVESKLKAFGGNSGNDDLRLDFETVGVVASEFGYEVSDNRFTETRFFEELDERMGDPDVRSRCPVVTVMGHVDHGKTSVLDVIRKKNVVQQEAGGITQHIGAYQVTHNGKIVTFVDTPGHAAFTSMRKRGAEVTDIVVLVVAADDGVMPQTKEAISHAQAAKVPIIVAINKMDLENANPDKIRNQLSEYGVISEEWGGEHLFVQLSAVKREGIEDLLNAILLVAEVSELKAPFNVHPAGVVIESRLDRFLGPLITVVVKQGKFKVGDRVISNAVTGKVRQMANEDGQRVKIAVPGTPVEISGMSAVVPSGDRVDVVPSEKDLKTLLVFRKEQELKLKHDVEVGGGAPSVEELMARIGEDQEGQQLNIVLKADVKGSEEALRASVEAIRFGDELTTNVVYSGCGNLTESDIDLAKTTDSILVLFHVSLTASMRKKMEKSGVRVVESNVIYEVLEKLEAILKAKKEPEYVSEDLGEAEVRQVFQLTKVGHVAGCYVKSGKMIRNCQVRVVRDGQVLGVSKVVSLKRFKDNVKEVQSGFEFGLSLDWKGDPLKEGDILQAFHEVEKQE